MQFERRKKNWIELDVTLNSLYFQIQFYKQLCLNKAEATFFAVIVFPHYQNAHSTYFYDFKYVTSGGIFKSKTLDIQKLKIEK